MAAMGVGWTVPSCREQLWVQGFTKTGYG